MLFPQLLKFRMSVLFVALFGLAGGLGFASANEPSSAVFTPGERVVFAIRKFGVKVGEASLTFDRTGPIDGQAAYLIVFLARAVNFYDEEKIFIDQQNFQPLRVERDLDIFGSKEKITEVYDRAAGEVRIHKEAAGKVSDQVLKKVGVENIYGFIYRYRRDGKMVKGDAFTMRLPTKDLEFKITSQDRIGAGGKVYEAFLMESQPKKYQLWFEGGERRIPLRIDGSMGMASTSMVMICYGTVAQCPDARLRRVSAEASSSEAAQANEERTPQMGIVQQSRYESGTMVTAQK